jgi:hypothetical protein
MFGPTHFSAPLKEQLGWVDYVGVGEVWNEVVELEPVQTSGKALRIPMDDDGTEFLIAEYRPQIGFDRQLPAGGVLFFKQDLNASRQPDPTGNHPYYLTLLERDHNGGLVHTHAEGGNRGEAGDAWAVGGTDAGDLHGVSSPALTLSDGSATPVVVHEVSVLNGRARLVVSTSTTPKLFLTNGATHGLLAVRVAGGVMPFALDVGSSSPVQWTVDGDDITGTARGPAPLVWPDAVISVRDAAGTSSEPVHFYTSGAATWRPTPDELASFFTRGAHGPASPTPGMADYLDRTGNQNGAYDVGDLRKWLRTRSP